MTFNHNCIKMYTINMITIRRTVRASDSNKYIPFMKDSHRMILSGSITEYAHAKINLSLDILGKRDDGYHLLKMVMQTVALSDTLTISVKDPGYGIKTSTGGNVPDDDHNLAFRAAVLMKETYGIKEGIDIKIEKKIPVAAGLAGGSSDAAAVLRGINRLSDSPAGPKELEKLGLKLGADVPYCISGGTKLCEGTGEMITGITPAFDAFPVLLIKPDEGVSTKEAYGIYDSLRSVRHPDTEEVISAIREGDLSKLGKSTANVLEEAAFSKVPVIREIKEFLIDRGVSTALMSGSGSTVFAIDEDKELLQRIGEEAGERFKDLRVFVTETRGIINTEEIK